jgi:hypothetical protein
LVITFGEAADHGLWDGVHVERQVLERDDIVRGGEDMRVGLVRHSRIENGVPTAQLTFEALDQLVVPCVVHGFAGALDEQDLSWHAGA